MGTAADRKVSASRVVAAPPERVFAVLADPESPRLHAARAAVYDARRHAETSLMATGIYRTASLESRAVVDGGD